MTGFDVDAMFGARLNRVRPVFHGRKLRHNRVPYPVFSQRHRLPPETSTAIHSAPANFRSRSTPRLSCGARTRSPSRRGPPAAAWRRSEEHTSELQSRLHLVCRLLLEKKKTKKQKT